MRLTHAHMPYTHKSPMTIPWITYMHPQTVPALACNPPVSAGGIITVTWSYLHTGGPSPN